MTYSEPARRSNSTEISADKLGLLDDVRLRSPQHVERRGGGSQIECWPTDLQQAEVIVMNTASSGRTRAAVAGFAEIVARFGASPWSAGLPNSPHRGRGRRAECRIPPSAGNAGGRVGILDHKDEAPVPCGTPTTTVAARCRRRHRCIAPGSLRPPGWPGWQASEAWRSPYCPSVALQIETRSVPSTRSG